MMISQMAYWHSDAEVIDTIENTAILGLEPEVCWDGAFCIQINDY